MIVMLTRVSAMLMVSLQGRPGVPCARIGCTRPSAELIVTALFKLWLPAQKVCEPVGSPGNCGPAKAATGSKSRMAPIKPKTAPDALFINSASLKKRKNHSKAYVASPENRIEE